VQYISRLSRYSSIKGFVYTCTVTAKEIAKVRLLLRRYATHRTRRVAALCQHVDVSRSDYDAFEALDEFGPLTPGELGALLSLTSGSVTALIDRLEALGWAERELHPNDRRSVVIVLTKKARKMGRDELKPYLKAVDDTTRQLTGEERAVVVRFLEDLLVKITAAPRPEEPIQGTPRRTTRRRSPSPRSTS
jgi:DNA-binding MarR family transcriptional regulator